MELEILLRSLMLWFPLPFASYSIDQPAHPPLGAVSHLERKSVSCTPYPPTEEAVATCKVKLLIAGIDSAVRAWFVKTGCAPHEGEVDS